MSEPLADAWFRHVQLLNPHARGLFVSGDRAAFLDAAERLIADVVLRMEESRATYRQLGERDLSKLMKELLGPLVPSDAEAHTNGHVDLTIRHPRGLGYKYLVECKIWNGNALHRDAMVQLLGYLTGQEGRAMCLAFFIDRQRMMRLLERLRGELATTNEPPAIGDPVDHPTIAGTFMTRHEHPSSGREIDIVHMGCDLWVTS
ncbi:MAG: hypothetical protein KC613_10490 [Myxococcales bacterium]|nr:hypothetical protein [Myxococcales bacterium]